MTLVDTSIAEPLRKLRNWQAVYSMIPNMRLYPEMKQLADLFFEKGEKIAVVTNSPKAYAEKVLQYFKIPFNHIIAYHDVKRRKPDIEPYSKAVSALKIPQGQTVWVFGDKKEDIIPAKVLSFIACACTWSLPQTDKAEIAATQPDHVFQTPVEALAFFESHFATKHSEIV